MSPDEHRKKAKVEAKNFIYFGSFELESHKRRQVRKPAEQPHFEEVPNPVFTSQQPSPRQDQPPISILKKLYKH